MVRECEVVEGRDFNVEVVEDRECGRLDLVKVGEMGVRVFGEVGVDVFGEIDLEDRFDEIVM